MLVESDPLPSSRPPAGVWLLMNDAAESSWPPIRLNKGRNPDPKTRRIAFGPALTVSEADHVLSPRALFFPFGHNLTVALGGFWLAGGPGWVLFVWGLTFDRWISKWKL